MCLSFVGLKAATSTCSWGLPTFNSTILRAEIQLRRGPTDVRWFTARKMRWCSTARATTQLAPMSMGDCGSRNWMVEMKEAG